MCFQFRNFAGGINRAVPTILLGGLFVFAVFPALDNFTGGKLKERFEDTGTSNRVEIAQTDVELFLEHPIAGTGVGLGYQYRRQMTGSGSASHTEFSRLLSEHGIFGVVALITLVVMALINIRRQKSIMGRALIAGVSMWCVLFMVNAGMRLAAPSFLWGLTFITIVNPNRPYSRLRFGTEWKK
jgi:hypothetical protein